MAGTWPEWIQAIAAIVGLFGLYKYTAYTKGILDATLAAQRAGTQPLLLCAFKETLLGVPIFTVTNVGQGVALDVKVAVIPEVLHISTWFVLDKAETKKLGDIAQHAPEKSFEVLFGERFSAATIAIQAEDLGGDSHQLLLSAVLYPSSTGTGDAWIVNQARLANRKTKPLSAARIVKADSNDRNHVG